MFSMALGDVRCIYVDGAGCYGRNGHEDAAADAALLAKAVDKPVRVQWSRADEHGWDPKGPPTLIDLRANLDASGSVTAWESEFFIPQGAAGTVDLVAATLSDKPVDGLLSPGGIIGDSAIGYKFPNIKTVCHRLETTPLRPSWIRTPGRMQNTFANECFLDEIAAAVSADPLEFRVKYTDPADKRGLDLLDHLAKLSNWQKRAIATEEHLRQYREGTRDQLREIRTCAHLCWRRRRSRSGSDGWQCPGDKSICRS